MYLKLIQVTALLTAVAIDMAAYADVTLNEQARNNFGINTTVATPLQLNKQWQASAQVLDSSTLIGSLADLHTAQAGATASNAELQRLEQLYKADTNAALKTVEAARAQAINDNSRVQTLQAQLMNAWGVGIARMKSGELDQLTRGLLAGTLVLIRAELTAAPMTLQSSRINLKLLNDNTTLTAKLLGAFPQTAVQSLGRSYLLSTQLGNGIELQPGQMLAAELQDAMRTTTGIKVPRAAVLRWQGQQWAYLEKEAGHYQRVPLTITQWLDDAALVSAGIKAGDKVVTTGAGLLLGAELKPADAAKQE